MPSWPALLLSPSLALAGQALAYALATPSCARQAQAPLHAVVAACLALSLVFTAMAWRAARRHADPSREDEPAARGRFVAQLGVGVGALSSLVLLALWSGPLWFSPCSSG